MRRFYRNRDINIISNSNNLRGGDPPKSNNKENKIKFDFKSKKNNTIRSLNDVENFLCDLKGLAKYIKIYYLLK